MKLIEFFKDIGQKCLLVAHNDKFDAPRLIHLIQELGLDEEFQPLIYGFSDSLIIFKKILKDHTCHKLEFLVQTELLESCEQAHDATFDVKMLELLAAKHLFADDLLRTLKSYEQVTNSLNKKDVKKTFLPLTGVLSNGMIDRLAKNGINYDSILCTFFEKKESGVIELLKQEENGKPTLIKSKLILDSIVLHLRNLSETIENGIVSDFNIDSFVSEEPLIIREE